MTVTLPGGNSGLTLYYTSATSVGYIAASTLDTPFEAIPVGDYTLVSSSGTDSNTGGSSAVLAISASPTTVTAANYNYIVDGAQGPVTLYVDNTGGSTSVLAGSGGGQIFLADNSNATIVAGDGNYWIGHPVLGATGTMDVTLGNGNDTINDLYGASTLTTGTGSSVYNLYEGNAIITLNGSGYDTINAGVEGLTATTFGVTDPGDEVSVTVANNDADHVLISENLADVSFSNGSAISTIRGGNGSTTINAGGTGAVIYTAESYDFFIGSASPASLSDQVTDNTATNDTLVAGAGTTTINATNASGTLLIESGTGDSTLDGGTGTDTFEIGALSTGSHTITINNWTSADTLELQGFGGLENITYATVTGAITASLTDGTVISFTDLTNSDQITHVTSV